MRKLIRADLRRILKKVNVWGLFIVSAFLCAMSVFIGYVSNPIWNGLVFVNKGVPAPIVYLLTSLAVLLGVYGDDQKSGALSTVTAEPYILTFSSPEKNGHSRTVNEFLIFIFLNDSCIYRL